ncbi:hypothetical protein M2404_000843 [Rheinheimera pacifica]|uniref:hypothetical protein n=1 Tax=Rheinheimera pacifica TaxID=173990 RepID=UPI00216A9880|nr:hypothetical protein [Rheinheimera pacifica]MCS4306520.1 hypothetical protein [Rheinheimera pacifica]
MLSWLARFFLIAGGGVASWFVSREANNFEVIQMVIAIFLFVLVAAVAAFWPQIRRCFNQAESDEK